MMNQLNIGGSLYSVVFNFNTYRNFCKLYGIDDINAIGEMFAGFNATSIESMEKQCNLILCALKEGSRKAGTSCSLTLDDIFAEMTEQPDLIAKATEMFSESISKGAEEGGQKKT
jgi:hypothetical protein